MDNVEPLSTKATQARFYFPKLLVFPKIQIKYALIHSFIGFMTFLCFAAGQYYFLQQSVLLDQDPQALQQVKESLFVYTFIISLVSICLIFLISIVVTHRFLGPFIAVKRGLDSLQKNDKFTKIEIRKTDEAHWLVEQLNHFLERLNEK